MNYIRIKNWSEYQHYKDRSAPWIKLHKELLSSHFWVMSNDASKLLAICLMLLAQRTDNKIPHDLEYIKRFGHLDSDTNISPLIDCGLIELIDENELVQDASAVLASCPPEERERRERERVTLPVKKQSAKKQAATSLPSGFTVSPSVEKWASENGHGRLAERLEYFAGYAKSSGKKYADWDQAFMNSIRDDWAKLGKSVPKSDQGWSKETKSKAFLWKMSGFPMEEFVP